MVTTVGGSILFSSDELAITQYATLEIGKGVQTHVVEFEQAACLSDHRSPKATYGY